MEKNRKRRKNISKFSGSNIRQNSRLRTGTRTRNTGMSRRRFLGTAAAVSALMAVRKQKGIVKGEGVDSAYDPEHIYKTLAAVCDTFYPGVPGVDVTVVDKNFAELGNPMDNLGAEGIDTPGAADLLRLPEDPKINPTELPFAIPCYVLLRYFLEGEDLLDFLIEIVDGFAPWWGSDFFKDLDYPARFDIFYYLDRVDLLEQKPFEIPPLGGGTDINTVFYLTQYFVGAIYLTELTNIIPSGFDNEENPTYKRNEDKTWNIIPNGAWDQMKVKDFPTRSDGYEGYPGPEYKLSDFKSKYRGLKITVSNKGVVFVQ